MSFAFSDGAPWKEFCTFAFLIAVNASLLRTNLVRQPFVKALSALANLCRKQHAFPEGDLLFDLRLVDLLRCAAGAIATMRYGEIFIQSLAHGNMHAASLSGVATCLAMLVMLGGFTPVATLLLMSSANILIDNYLRASTLGTMVMSMVLLFLFLAPAGSTFSLDAWMARRGGACLELSRFTGLVGGAISKDRLICAKFFSLLAYYCVCIYSVVWHLHDDAWTSGLVIAWTLLARGANPHYVDAAWSLYTFAPWIYVNFARLAIAGMFLWYFLVLPGLFISAITRWFVVMWGLAFFLISTFVLPLSYLGWYELILWACLFIVGSTAAKTLARAVQDLVPRFSRFFEPTIKFLSTIAQRLSLGSGASERSTFKNHDFQPGILPLSVIGTLLMLSAAFLMRLPIYGPLAPEQGLAAQVRKLAGASPLAFGIGKINVFNTEDLSLFSSLVFAYEDDLSIDLADPDEIGTKSLRLGATNDADRYSAVAERRRAARMNLGCDRDLWLRVAPIYAKTIRLQPEYAGLSTFIVQVSISAWPSQFELTNYLPVEQTLRPVCRARINTQTAALLDLAFVQSGVQDRLKQKGYTLQLSARHAEAAIAYPCRADANFLNAIVDGTVELSNDADIVTRTRELQRDVRGRFSIDCLALAHDLLRSTPIISDSVRAAATPLACEAGRKLLDALGGVPGLPSTVAAAIKVKAQKARNTLNDQECVDAASSGRSAYWETIIEKSSPKNN